MYALQILGLVITLTISSEDRLILACAQVNPSEKRQREIGKLLLVPLDWQDIYQKAQAHGMIQLLYWNIHSARLEAVVPQVIMKELRKYYYANIARNIFLQNELIKLLRLCRERGIEIMPLKGAVFVPVYYKNIGLRTMVDLDLLVKKEDLRLMDELLLDQGYNMDERYRKEIFSSDERFRKYVDVTHHEFPLYFKEEINLDIHWDVGGHISRSKYYTIDIDGFWTSQNTVTLEKLDVPTLSPENQLLHLCGHGFTSGFHLKGLCDISVLVEYYGDRIHWDIISSRARECRIGKIVYFALYLTQLIFDIQFPKEVLRNLRPRWARLYENDQLLAQFFMDYKPMYWNFFMEMLVLSTMEKDSQRVHKILSHMIPDRNLMMKTYNIKNPHMIWYYHIKRFHGLFIRMLEHFIRSISNRRGS